MVVLVCGLAFATLVWRECASTEIGDMDRDGIDAFAGFLAYRLKEGPKGSPSQEVGDTQLIALGHDVEKFRGAAVMVDDTKALAGLPEVAPGAFDDFLKGEISAKFPFIWPYVIAGSLTMMANALGDEPVAAFYNPYFDVAILTKWKFEAEAAAGPGYQLIEAVPVSAGHSWKTGPLNPPTSRFGPTRQRGFSKSGSSRRWRISSPPSRNVIRLTGTTQWSFRRTPAPRTSPSRLSRSASFF